jgi:DNA-directed RNA polymerase specialized sigma24 family protein
MRRNRARRADLDQFAPSPAPTRLPDQEVVALQEAAALHVALGQLDPQCQKLLGRLFLAETEESYGSVAKGLRIKLNSVGPLRSRCLMKLRKNLHDLGIDED